MVVAEGAQQYTPKDELSGIVKVSTSASVPVSVSASNQYGTLVLPFSAALPEGLEAYTCGSADDSHLYLSPATSLEAFTPYILFAENGYSGTLSGTVDPAAFTTSAQVGYLRGVLATTSVNDGFIMQNKGDGPCFYKVYPYTYALAAGKCYVVLPSDVAQNISALRISRQAASLSSPSLSQEEIPVVLYNLQGQRVTPTPETGILINRGKKIIRVAQ